MVFIEPSTRQRVTRAPHSGDIVFEANPPDQSDVLMNEDVPLIGEFTDRFVNGTNTGGVPSREQQMWGGHANSLFGTDASIEGKAKVGNLTDEGKNADTHRSRKRQIYKDFYGN